jgi:hypothetical protein
MANQPIVLQDLAIKEKTISTRENFVYTERYKQLATNILGWHGGKKYIYARLSRFPGESTLDWEGGTRTDGSSFDGRRDVSHVIPYLDRIVTKINQHVFSVQPKRDVEDSEVINDVTLSGESVDDLMVKVNSYLTVCGWCWIGIDAPVIDMDAQISQAEKEALKIRPYWSVYSPLEVVDWYFGKSGKLEWILTEGVEQIASDPFIPPVSRKYRKLWQMGRVTKFVYKEDSEAIETTEIYGLSLTDEIPFVLVGTISTESYGFDNLESINKTIMDLESCNRQNFYNSVFPQMKLPVSVLDTVMQKYNVTAEAATQMVMGYAYPILMSENDKDPGYIMPDSASIGIMRDELTKLKNELFDSTGLMLQKETRQVASAESKAWDFLDISQVMIERARILEQAEKKAVSISVKFDSDFPEWNPEYNNSFDVSSFKSEMESLVMASQLSLPDEMLKFIIKRVFELIKINGKTISQEEETSIMEAINNFSDVKKEVIGQLIEDTSKVSESEKTIGV